MNLAFCQVGLMSCENADTWCKQFMKAPSQVFFADVQHEAFAVWQKPVRHGDDIVKLDVRGGGIYGTRAARISVGIQTI